MEGRYHRCPAALHSIRDPWLSTPLSWRGTLS